MIRLVLAALILSTATPIAAQERVFDGHVHLWKGAESLRDYVAQSRAAGYDPAAAAMWFGGHNQALAGNPDAIRAGNAGAVQVTINGEDRGSLGAEGEVVTRTLQIPATPAR